MYLNEGNIKFIKMNLKNHLKCNHLIHASHQDLNSISVENNWIN